VPESSISIIPDEQEAVEAALRMGEPGDLLLIFADALTRSWKQITKFSPSGTTPANPDSRPRPPPSRAPTAGVPAAIDQTNSALTNGGGGRPGAHAPDFSLEGLIRDERGVRMAPESED
jgi:cyanophycin synthetase